MNEFDEVMENFKAFAFDVKKRRTRMAVNEMLVRVQINSDTMVPIATGALINSKFRNITDTFIGMVGRTGYKIAYASYVHEAPGIHKGRNTRRSNGLGFVWDPDAEPKFLMKGADRMVLESARDILTRSYAL